MSTDQKPRGGSTSELTKLKLLWRDSLSEDAKDYWRSLFSSPEKTLPEIRQEIRTKLKINLTRDNQLSGDKGFVAYVKRQDALDLEAEKMREEERRLTEEFGNEWTLDQIREEVLKRSYARALATGDFCSGRKTIVQDLNVQKVDIEKRKLAILEKKAAAYDRAQAALEAAKKSKGGLTPETLKKIEQELNLL